MRVTGTRTIAAAFTAAALSAAAGAGCSPPPMMQPVPHQDIEQPAIVDLTDPTKPPPAERFQQPEGGDRIAPGDDLELRILGLPELSGTYLVDQGGRINLSLIGSVAAAGKSSDELDRDLTNAFGAYYRNLDVAVNVRIRAQRAVFVLGEVARPGRFELSTGERVIHAVASAGGMTPSARENSIVLLRREPDGQDHAYRLDFSRVHTQVAPRDIYLQPNDVVFVPKSVFKTVTDFADDLLEVVERAALSSLYIDDVSRRARSITIPR